MYQFNRSFADLFPGIAAVEVPLPLGNIPDGVPVQGAGLHAAPVGVCVFHNDRLLVRNFCLRFHFLYYLIDHPKINNNK